MRYATPILTSLLALLMISAAPTPPQVSVTISYSDMDGTGKPVVGSTGAIAVTGSLYQVTGTNVTVGSNSFSWWATHLTDSAHAAEGNFDLGLSQNGATWTFGVASDPNTANNFDLRVPLSSLPVGWVPPTTGSYASQGTPIVTDTYNLTGSSTDPDGNGSIPATTPYIIHGYHYRPGGAMVDRYFTISVTISG